MSKARFAFVALAVAIVAACAGSGATTAPNGRGAPAVGPLPFGPNAPIAQPAPADAQKAQAPGGQAQAGSGGVLGVLFDADKVLVLTAQLQLRSSDPWTIGDKVQQLALGAGGDVVGVSQSGSGDNKSATVTIRVPNDRFNTVLNQIKALDGADLQNVQVTGEDKTADFIDLDARLKAKQQEESRYLALLARADKVDDILKIDQVLSGVRAQVEQLQGQLNALKNRSAMATISVAVTTMPLVAPVPDTGWQPQRTFQAAIASLTGMLRVLADAAIWALVWAWLPLAGLLLAFALSRRARPA